MLAIQLGEMAEHCYAVERDPETGMEFPTNPVLSSENPWYERETHYVGAEDKFDPLPVCRQQINLLGAFPKLSQERSE